MNILDIAIAKKLAGGGGGSGTDNYNDLSNLPKINDTTLSGNKSSSALGLQSEINSDSKLASDLVDDTNQDNKFVTSTEKNTWNAKQNAIDSDHKLSSDLVDDANKTNKFVTSTEKNTWNAKQNAIDSEHKLSSSLVSFTDAEAAALASGIDSSKVGQISTNQTNILYVLGKTGHNLLKVTAMSGTVSGVEYTVNKNTITISSNGSNTTSTLVLNSGSPLFKASNNVFAIDKVMPAGATITVKYTDGTIVGFNASNRNTNATLNSSKDVESVYLYIDANKTISETISVMICTQDDWAVTHEITPYQGLPNSDLTYLEAEDRAALAEEIDAGAKNKFQITQASTTGYTVNSDGTVTATGALSNSEFNMGNFLTGTLSNLVLSGCTGGSDSTYSLLFQYRISGGNVQAIRQYDDPVIINLTNVSWSALYIEVKSLSAGQTKVFKPMITTKAAFGVSPKFVPYKQDPFYQVPINHNMIYRGRNLGATLTDAQHTALSSGNFTDLYLGDYWTKTVTIPAGTYTGGDGEEVTVPAQTNITLKAVIADFDTFYAGYASSYAGINTHHAAVIVTGFSNVVWNGTNSTAGGYVASLIHKWLVGSALPQIETWFGSAKVLSHQKLLTNAITGDAASGWAWSSQKISLLSENQMYGSKVWGNSKAANGGYEPGEAFKHLNVFNHIDANLLFGNKNIWLRDIASAGGAADLSLSGIADILGASHTGIAPAALILLS